MRGKKTEARLFNRREVKLSKGIDGQMEGIICSRERGVKGESP